MFYSVEDEKERRVWRKDGGIEEEGLAEGWQEKGKGLRAEGGQGRGKGKMGSW